MSEIVPEYGGCLWPVDPACFSEDWASMDEPMKERALALASSTLERLTARRVGVCPITVRPYQQSCGCFVPTQGGWPATGAFSPGLSMAGTWVNNCGPVCEDPTKDVRLPAPVGRIDQVKVNGAVIPPSDYHLYQGNRLTYTGAGAGWPVNQDVSKPDSAAGTFSVTYLNAYPVDALGAYAAGVLANEFALACSDRTCRLPDNVTSIVRQGVSMQLPGTAFLDGLTGIREVDTWVALWNPRAALQATTVWYPGSSSVSW